MTLPTSMSDDNVCRWTGSAWDCALSSVAPGALIRTGVTAFSPWAVGYAAIADLSASNNGPTLPGNVTLLSATISGGSEVAYTWAFGDGTTGSGQNPSHTCGWQLYRHRHRHQRVGQQPRQHYRHRSVPHVYTWTVLQPRRRTSATIKGVATIRSPQSHLT